ncbi:unnamed protein product [Trifolium pratense]|uniref:Uncharacterized protein n=1 Tax=Trifolium pratense TaxID=57577 RepID=A0ACB0JP95_TRIPR|nr:unnamed protein product [Trifolium pratense]
MNSVAEVVLDICSREVEAVVNRFMMIVWGLWHNRNEWIWNQKQMNPDQINHWAQAQWSEWNAAQRRVTADATEGSAVQRRWVKPNTGKLKCNVDAACHRSIDKTSYGCCLRDSNGDFIQALSGWCNPELSVCEGEALGMWQAMSWVQNLGLSKVIFESDSKTLVDAVNSKSVGGSEFHALVSLEFCLV